MADHVDHKYDPLLCDGCLSQDGLKATNARLRADVMTILAEFAIIKAENGLLLSERNECHRSTNIKLDAALAKFDRLKVALQMIQVQSDLCECGEWAEEALRAVEKPTVAIEAID